MGESSRLSNCLIMLRICHSGVNRSGVKLMSAFLFVVTLTVICAQSAIAQGNNPSTAPEYGTAAGADSGGFMSMMLIFGALALVVIIGGFIALRLLRKRQTSHPAPRANPQAGQPRLNPALAPAPGNATQADPSQEAAPTPRAFRPKLGPTPLPAAKNGRARIFTSRFSQRRREFDYNRYFADLMSTVSGHTSAVEAPMGYALEVTRLTEGVAAGAPSHAGVSNSELIANQTTLIEEQRRLIQEQTRLIEEKTRLIAEKNQLLKVQEQMLDHKLA